MGRWNDTKNLTSLIDKSTYNEYREIDELMQLMQAETVNNGGSFHFSKLINSEGESVEKQIANLHLKIPEHFSINEVSKLKLIKINQLNIALNSFCDDWASYKGPCPDKSENTNNYQILRDEFTRKVIDFLNSKGIISAYKLEGINTWHSIGFDYINEDIIVETKESIFVIHFGFSS